jgi:pimeloyl-ACP methyl ester carboxylesterase
VNYAPYADYPLSTTDTGIAFRYAPARNLDSVPIVLLHGLSQQGDYWWPVIESLGSERAIVSIDLNGHGESRRLKSDYQVSSVSKDCVSVLDQLEIDQACVVGHSWGASVALHFAANFADRTHSAVLVDGGAFTPANILNRGSISRERLRVELTPPKGPFAESELRAHYLPPGIDLSVAEQESVMQAIGRTYQTAPSAGLVTTIGFERHMAVLDSFFDYNPDSDLELITVPSWILIACDLNRPTGTDTLDDWARAKHDVDGKIQGKMNIALQHWYGAVHDVPLYWPDRVADLIGHAARRRRGRLT